MDLQLFGPDSRYLLMQQTADPEGPQRDAANYVKKKGGEFSKTIK